MIYHVLNRGNGRMRIFHKAEDYEAFERVLAEGLERYAVELLTYCLMPNHWHLVTRPKTDEALGHWMRWVGVTHVRRYHEHYHTHLPRAVQEFSCCGGRLLLGIVPLRRSQSFTRGIGGTG
jgi:REP element-mobilizing transposase RayT